MKIRKPLTTKNAFTAIPDDRIRVMGSNSLNPDSP